MKIDFSQLTAEDFEFLIEALLIAKGFVIKSRPGRGPDRGKDIIATRTITDDMGVVHAEKWLIECKHHFVSGKSVTEKDLNNIGPRMQVHHANRYLVATSTLLSEVARDQISAISEDPSNIRMAIFWTRTDIEQLLSTYRDVWERFFFSWELEANEAANYLNEHHHKAHRGAILWCPSVTAIFGNDGYLPNSDWEDEKESAKSPETIAFYDLLIKENIEANQRSQDEVSKLRQLLKMQQIHEIAFSTCDEGYTWCILVESSAAKELNALVWTCYPPGTSSHNVQQSAAFERLNSYWHCPHKATCPAELPVNQKSKRKKSTTTVKKATVKKRKTPKKATDN